ncbi:nucleotide sugar dehydrogenase [bacterium]|nr:nucleotide sugar dehydrogenase [bacterium]
MENRKKIAVIGLGYVGLANALVLANHFEVVGFDNEQKRIDELVSGQSYIDEDDLKKALLENQENISFKHSREFSASKFETIFLCLPTNYSAVLNSFDTSILKKYISSVASEENSAAILVIRSTIPVGFTDEMNSTYPNLALCFAPEFLREGRSVWDCLHPDRIIVGGNDSQAATKIINLLSKVSLNPTTTVCTTSARAAEIIKVFSNTYLAMRVAFFNELDSFLALHQINSAQVIQGICADKRIGDIYNNPSFGFGGYCLPKDTLQAISTLSDMPSSLVKSVLISNKERKEFIFQLIKDRNPKTVGIFSLAMKGGSDNYRESAILDIITLLQKSNIDYVIHDENLPKVNMFSDKQILDLGEFKQISDVIVANRMDTRLGDVAQKLICRDIFNEN